MSNSLKFTRMIFKLYSEVKFLKKTIKLKLSNKIDIYYILGISNLIIRFNIEFIILK
jgi:hypothetical protein